jgi:hypothetical protein
MKRLHHSYVDVDGSVLLSQQTTPAGIPLRWKAYISSF